MHLCEIAQCPLEVRPDEYVVECYGFVNLPGRCISTEIPDKESDSDISDSELSAGEDHDDVVIHEIGSSTSDEEVFELSETQYTVYTRSGRRAGSWKKSLFQ